MEHQDFKTVVWTKKTKKTHQHIQRTEVSSKFKKLDIDDPEILSVIKRNIRINIQQGRVAKKLTQKQLAINLNIPISTISSYEDGTAIPNKNILRKIGIALNIKL
jgi:ribosome-binding protein aMBF1 (putative translation factor)